MRRPVLALLTLLLAACGSEPVPALRVGDVGFPAEQVANLSSEQIRVLADLTAFGQAIAHGEDSVLVGPMVERRVERSRLAALPLVLGAQAMGITEKDLRAAYAGDPEWELEVRHVVRLAPAWASEKEREEARAIAEEVHRQAVAGEDFAALAAEFSEEPGAAERGGLLEPGRRGSWVDPFWEAALALEPGEISPVVESEYGFHVLRLDDRAPVPIEEADRRRILSIVVPPERAAEAMQEWVAGAAPPVVLDPPAVLAAREALAAGRAPDTLVLARWPGGEYTARDLAIYRATLDSEDRERLDAADDVTFGRYVQSDAAEAMRADMAEEMGVPADAGIREEARREWEQQMARWAAGLGFTSGVDEESIRTTALRGLIGTGQDVRIARIELEPLRPLLRARYPISGEAAPAASSSSETPNSGSTR